VNATSGVVRGAGGDLTSRGAIHDLVVVFYREIVFDELLEHVFGDVAEVDWAVHIPHLIDYWSRVLLGERGYDGAIVRAHAHVHSIEPLRLEHFERWYDLWVASIDASWAGPRAEHAKRHAARIGGILSSRLIGVRWEPDQVAVVEEPTRPVAS
jgi:hemoglobin